MLGSEKGIWCIDRKDPYDPVCEIDPVMGQCGVYLHAVNGIKAILDAIDIECKNSLQNIYEFFPLVLIHFQLTQFAVGKWEKLKNAWKAIKILHMVAQDILDDLRAYLCAALFKAAADRLPAVKIRAGGKEGGEIDPEDLSDPGQ